jgi:drug/metabolite transporter (DMT)-like permease
MGTDSIRRGALYMVAAGFFFAATGALVKLAAAKLPNEMVVFMRSFSGLLALVPWLVHRRGRGLRTARWRGHLVRSLAGLGAMYCYFFAIAHLPLADAVLLNYTTPLFVPFIALFWLGERMPRGIWIPIGIGFVGIVLILKPGVTLFAPAALIGLLSGLLAALALAGVRRLTHTEPIMRIVFYFTLVATLVSAVPLLWTWRAPDPADWLLLVSMGALATVGQFLLTRAYAEAPAAQVGPFSYVIVLFAAMFGWGLWGDMPDGLSLAGTALVVVAGIVTIRLAGKPRASGPAPPALM